LAIRALDELKVKPLDLQVATVVVCAQVIASNTCKVDLVKNRVVCSNKALFFPRLFHRHVQLSNLGKLTKVLGRHHVFTGYTQAAVGKRMQSAEVREVRLLIQVGKLDQGPFPGLGACFAGEGKVTDVTGQHTTVELMFNSA
jgi:hypothetical protein